MVLYLSGNFQVFKKDLALWVVLVYGNDPTIHNTTMHNSCITYIVLFLFTCHDSYINYISFFACHKQTDDGGYSLYHIEKLKDFPEQFKSGLIPFL